MASEVVARCNNLCKYPVSVEEHCFIYQINKELRKHVNYQSQYYSHLAAPHFSADQFLPSAALATAAAAALASCACGRPVRDKLIAAEPASATAEATVTVTAG